MQTHSKKFRATYLAAHLFHASFGESFPISPSASQLEELINREVDPKSFSCANDFRDAYALAEGFSKTPFELPGVDRAATAFRKFWEAEGACAVANQRLVDAYSRPNLSVKRLRRAQALIANVLGQFDWNLARRFCSFGPGATTSLSRRQAAHGNKWTSNHVTKDCLPLVLALARENPGWSNHGLKLVVVEGNKVTTVPKNAKTDRVIAVEPDWNMFFQRGIGGALRWRLNRIGLLTQDAQHRHREMAMWGSVTGSIATIDLKAASDSVSLALCEALLPADWFRAMLITRSPTGSVNGETVIYEKISSMGNGFTFELETLIFWALARACCSSGTVSVYGDDIICPSQSANEVISLLVEAGFEVNTKKTHIDGPFRESCGGHFFLGHDVTPPYFRRILEDEIHFISAANRISAHATLRWGFARDIRFRALHTFLASKTRFRGPLEAGDGVVHESFDACVNRKSVWWSRRYQQWNVKCLLPTLRYETVEGWGPVFASLFGGSAGGEVDLTVESNSKHRVGWRIGKMTANSWTGPGPWV